MRVFVIGIAGVLASSAMYGLSQLADGFPGAAAYVLALLLAPVSIGVAIATAINRRLDAPVEHGVRTRRATRRASELRPCGGCGAPMMAMDFAWVCSACDLVPARR